MADCRAGLGRVGCPHRRVAHARHLGTCSRKGAHGRGADVPKGPAIAVLPFVNLSGDPKQDYFSDGLTEDILTELSGARDLRVLARNTTFQYKGKAVDVGKLGRDLKVRYVLEGSVRRAEDQLRVTAQLIDAETGSHICADRYDREMAHVFLVQDKIVNQVVAKIAGTTAPSSGLVLESDLSLQPRGETMLTARIIAIVIGAIAGWLAGLLVQGTGFGLIGDIVVGVLGALIAGFLFPMLGIALALGGGLLGAIILAFIGAVILLVIVKVFKQITA